MPPFPSPSCQALSQHFAPTSTTSVVSAASIAMAAIRRRRTKRARRIRHAGYRGKPTGTQIVATCARCHSDAGLMRKFGTRTADRSGGRVRHERPRHAPRRAATRRWPRAPSCHHAHGVRRVKDARAPVFPTNVAALCASCHADAAAHEGVHLVRRRRYCDQPARRVPEERALRRAHQAERPLGTDVQRLPRQPRRRAAGGRGGQQRLRHVSRGLRRRSLRRARTARSSTAHASSATAITQC